MDPPAGAKELAESVGDSKPLVVACAVGPFFGDTKQPQHRPPAPNQVEDPT